MTPRLMDFQHELFELYKKHNVKGFSVAITGLDEGGSYESGILYANKGREYFSNYELKEMNRILREDVIPSIAINSRVNTAVFEAHQILNNNQ